MTNTNTPPFKPWWEYPVPEESDFDNEDLPPPVPKPKMRPLCECGAVHTSFPKHHSRWCREHPDNKDKYWK